MVGLASHLCYSFTLLVEELPPKRKLDMLRYALEEQIPCDADRLAISRHDVGSEAFVIAIDAERLDETSTKSIEANAIAICPLIFLAIADLPKDRLRSSDVIVWFGEDGVDLVRLKSGQPVRWQWLNRDEEKVLKVLRRWFELPETKPMHGSPESTQTRTILLVGNDGEGVLEDVDWWTIQVIKQSQLTAATRSAEEIVAGKLTPPFDLRDGPFKTTNHLGPLRRPILITTTCVAVSLGLVSIAIQGRIRAYHRASDAMVARQEKAFLKVFPNQSIPVGIVTRLESEHLRMQSLKVDPTDLEEVPESCLPVLHQWLMAVNRNEAPIRIDRLEVLPKKLQAMTGETDTFESLQLITTSMQEHGFQVPPVSANRTSGGVSISLNGIKAIEVDR